MKSVRVVVAEAAAADTPILAPILEAKGFEIVGSASSADELREVLSTTAPQVVVFDAGMSAPTVLSTRDWAPGAGIVVVWPTDVLAPAADEQVEPSHVASELGDAVRRAMRVYHTPSGTVVSDGVPAGAAGSGREVLAGGGEAAGKMSPRRTLTFAMASLLIVLAVAAVALERGHQSGEVAQSTSPSPPAAGPTGPTGPIVTPGGKGNGNGNGNGSGQQLLPPIAGLIPGAAALGEVASPQPTGPSGPTVPGGSVPGPTGAGPANGPHGELGGSSQGTGNDCFNGKGDSGHHGKGDSGYHGNGDSGYHGNGDSGHHGDGDSRRGNCGHHGNGDSGLHRGRNSGQLKKGNSGQQRDRISGHHRNSGHHGNGNAAGGHKEE